MYDKKQKQTEFDPQSLCTWYKEQWLTFATGCSDPPNPPLGNYDRQTDRPTNRRTAQGSFISHNMSLLIGDHYLALSVFFFKNESSSDFFQCVAFYDGTDFQGEH